MRTELGIRLGVLVSFFVLVGPVALATNTIDQHTVTAGADDIWIHHFPGGLGLDYRLYMAPTGWACGDDNNGGAQVGTGDLLVGPDPSVTCTRSAGAGVCVQLGSGGYETSGTATLDVTSKCSGFAKTTTIDLLNPKVFETKNGKGPTPWSCSVAESGSDPRDDWWVHCTVNAIPPINILTCGDVGTATVSDSDHTYWTSDSPVVFGQDLCPSSGLSFSGELGFGVGAVWLFSRAGADANGDGSGVTACYGSPADGHHGSDSTINVLDDLFGGAVGFTVTRDYNRTPGNTGFTGLAQNAGPGNSGGTADCGDGLIEPCPDGVDDSNATASGNDPAGGCNHLDASIDVLPVNGLCAGWQSPGDDDSLGNIDPTDPAFPSRVAEFVTETASLPLGVRLPAVGPLEETGPGALAESVIDPDETAAEPEPGCDVPMQANTWTAPAGTSLADAAGADGAILVIPFSNARVDRDHAGAGTTGIVWTS